MEIKCRRENFLKPWDRLRVPGIVLVDREGVPHSGVDSVSIDKAGRRSMLLKRLRNTNQ